MEDKDYREPETEKKGLWRIIDSIEGDKVIWIIVLLLILISVLAIFSSTPLLSQESRIEIMKSHGKVAISRNSARLCKQARSINAKLPL